MFPHLHTVLTQSLFLPRFGIGRHVHHGPKPQGRSQHTNGHTQIASRANRHLVTRKYCTGRWQAQAKVVRPRLNQIVLDSQTFGQLQHLVKAATGLYGAGHRQLMVGLDPEPAHAGRQTQGLLQCRYLQQVRLDTPLARRQLRKQVRQQGRKTLESAPGILHIDQTQTGRSNRCVAAAITLAVGVGPHQRPS